MGIFESIGTCFALICCLGYFLNFVALLYFDVLVREDIKDDPSKENKIRNMKFMLGLLFFFLIPFSIAIGGLLIHTIRNDDKLI